MPKSPQKAANSKIRFIMLEADLADGDLTQITNAISNALRPNGTTRSLTATRVASQLPSNSAETESPVEDLDAGADVEAENETVGEERGARRAAPRRYPTPSVLDVDLNSGDMPFETFAQGKQPQNVAKKHLLVAYWFKTYRDTLAITVDHAYTCYKKMGWSTNVKDFSQPFRDLSRQGRGSVKDGNFTINHIGEDVVAKMSA